MRGSLGFGRGSLRVGKGSKEQNWEGPGNQTRAVSEVVFGGAGLGGFVGNRSGESLGGIFWG